MRVFLGILGVIVAILVGGFFYLNQPDIPRSVLEAKYHATSAEFVTLPDGARVHFRERGAADAPVLLLLHGSNSSFMTWEPWSKSLSDHFHVIALDLPGHGLTGAVPNHDYSETGMVKFVDEFADAKHLQSFALAGNSMGGGVAAHYAEDHPARVSKLILVDAGGMWVRMGDKIPLAFKLMGNPWFKPVMLHITPRSLVTEGLNDAIVRKAVINDAMIDWYWDFTRMEGTREATFERSSRDRSGKEWSYVHDHVGQIKAPTLILWGEQDHLVPVDSAHAYNKAIPGSKLTIYPATGHIPMEEVADQSSADVRAFLSQPAS
jgi:pimeloyl-ACP methyl ester carboxylesterase